MEIYIDAKNMILGRMSTYVAKRALLGDIIKIFNCESAVITGSREFVFEKYHHKNDRGTASKGPFQPKMPDRFVRRIIRGMLPFKTPRGREAFGRVLCYIGVPEEFKGKKLISLQNADIADSNSIKYVSVQDICRHIGGKI